MNYCKIARKVAIVFNVCNVCGEMAMSLKEWTSSVITIIMSATFLYFSFGALQSYSGEEHSRADVTLSPEAAMYIYLRQ